LRLPALETYTPRMPVTGTRDTTYNNLKVNSCVSFGLMLFGFLLHICPVVSTRTGSLKSSVVLLINYCVYKFLSWFVMIVLCCVVLYDFVHCLLLRRNNKYIKRNTTPDFRLDDRTREWTVHQHKLTRRLPRRPVAFFVCNNNNNNNNSNSKFI